MITKAERIIKAYEVALAKYDGEIHDEVLFEAIFRAVPDASIEEVGKALIEHGQAQCEKGEELIKLAAKGDAA